MAHSSLMRAVALFAVLSLALLSCASAAPHPSVSEQPSGAAASILKRAGLDGFCPKFKNSCRKVCVTGQSGDINVQYACKKDADSGLYEFSCRCNKVLHTDEALAGVSGAQPTTKTLIGSTTTTLATTEVDDTLTLTSGTRTYTSVKTDTRTFSLSARTSKITSSIHTTKTDFADGTTTVLTLVTSTPVTTKRVTKKETQTVATVTATRTNVDFSASQGARTTGVPLLRVAAPKAGKGSVDSGQFCDAYTAACDRACVRVDSTRNKLTCSAVNGDTLSNYYNLYCSCANHKLETLHALSDLDDNGAITTISVTAVSTSISYTTLSVTATEIAPVSTTTYLTTKSVAAFEPASSTIYETFQTTITRTLTKATGATKSVTSTKIGPTSVAHTTVGTTTISATKTLSTTTELLLAPTGRVRILADPEQFNNDCLGDYAQSVNLCPEIGWMYSTVNNTRVGLGASKDGAVDVVLVKSPDTSGNNANLYTLVDVESGNALVNQGQKSEVIQNSQPCTRSEFTVTRTIEEAKAEKRNFIYWAQLSGIQQAPDGGNQLGMAPIIVANPHLQYSFANLLSEPKQVNDALLPDDRSIISITFAGAQVCQQAYPNQTIAGVFFAFEFSG